MSRVTRWLGLDLIGELDWDKINVHQAKLIAQFHAEIDAQMGLS